LVLIKTVALYWPCWSFGDFVRRLGCTYRVGCEFLDCLARARASLENHYGLCAWLLRVHPEFWIDEKGNDTAQCHGKTLDGLLATLNNLRYLVREVGVVLTVTEAYKRADNQCVHPIAETAGSG
jgi:hypothetical protein